LFDDEGSVLTFKLFSIIENTLFDYVPIKEINEWFLFELLDNFTIHSIRKTIREYEQHLIYSGARSLKETLLWRLGLFY
jgi:hypothetical protein